MRSREIGVASIFVAGVGFAVATGSGIATAAPAPCGTGVDHCVSVDPPSINLPVVTPPVVTPPVVTPPPAGVPQLKWLEKAKTFLAPFGLKPIAPPPQVPPATLRDSVRQSVPGGFPHAVSLPKPTIPLSGIGSGLGAGAISQQAAADQLGKAEMDAKAFEKAIAAQRFQASVIESEMLKQQAAVNEVMDKLRQIAGANQEAMRSITRA